MEERMTTDINYEFQTELEYTEVSNHAYNMVPVSSAVCFLYLYFLYRWRHAVGRDQINPHHSFTSHIGRSKAVERLCKGEV